MIRQLSMEMVLLVDNDPTPLPHHITFSYYCQSCPILRLLCPHTSESPTYCKSLPFFYFLTFEKADCATLPWMVGWLASPLIFLLQMIPLFPSLVFFSSVNQIFSFTKYFPPFPSFFVFSTKRHFPSSLFISSARRW